MPSHPAADPTTPVAPTREDPVVASASEVLGGPLGRHAVIGTRGALAALVALMTAVVALVAAGVTERAHCLARGWSSPDHFWHACYSDIPVVYDSSGLSGGVGPFGAASTLDQPLPTALLSWATAALVPRSGVAGLLVLPAERARWYFALWAVLVAVALVLLVALLVRSQPRHPWRVAHLASPALPFVALVSFEIVPVLLAGAGLAAWSVRRRGLAGLLLALAVVARPWALLAVVAVVLVAVRTGRTRDAATMLGSGAATATLVLAVTAALRRGNPLAVYADGWSGPAGYGSPWYLPAMAQHAWPVGLLTLLSALGWVLALGAGAYLALVARRRPRIGELLLVMTVIVAVTGTSLPVQAALWLLLALAVVGVTWREHLVWAGIEVAYFVAVWLFIAASSDPNRGLPAGWFAVFLVARLVAWGWIAVAVWRRAVARPAAVVVVPAVAPESAPVPSGRPGPASADTEPTPGRVIEHDELAGPLAGCPDHTVVSFV